MRSDWRSTTLADCADWVSGGTPSKQNPDYWNGDVPWVSAKDMKSFRLYDSKDHVTSDALNNGTKVVPARSLLLLVRGMTLHDDLPICMAMREMAFNQDVKALVPKAHVVPEFLAYWLLANKRTLLELVDSASHGTGRIHTNVFKKVELRLPPLPTQRRIASILGSLDDKIELNRRMNRTLERMAQALFKSWFIDFDPVRAKAEGDPTAGGLPERLAALFPDRLVDSELGGVPHGWQLGKLADVADNPRRTVQPSEVPPATPYIGLQHMPRRCIALDAWGRADEVGSGKSRFREGEILFGKLRPYFHKVGIAPLDGVCSTDILVVAPKSAEWHGYVLSLVSSKPFVDYTDAHSAGTKMPRTNWKDMGRYRLALPPAPLARVFQDQVASNHQRIGVAVRQNRRLAGLRDTLLPKLLSGELEVPEAKAAVEEVV